MQLGHMTLIVGVASRASGEHTRSLAISGHRDMPLRTDIPEIPYRKQHQMKFRHNTSIVTIILGHPKLIKIVASPRSSLRRNLRGC